MKKLLNFNETHSCAWTIALSSLAILMVISLSPQMNAFGKGGTAPGAPTLVSATAGDTEVALSWTAPKSDGGSAITDYVVQYVAGKTTQTANVGSSKATSYIVTGLTNGTEYTFSVAAINSVGAGTYSSTQTATPASSATAPDAPTLVSVVAGDGEATLAWTAPDSDGGSDITGYTIKQVADKTTNIDPNTTKGGSYTVTGLTNGTEYTFSIAAINAKGTSDYSSTQAVTPQAAVTTPDAPGFGSISADESEITFAWTAPDNGGSDITGYTLSYTPAGGSEQTVDLDSETLSYTISELTNGTEYTVKVRAENAEGAGPYGATKTATPFTVPGVPTDIEITPGDTTLAVSWTAPASNGASIARYTVSYKAGRDKKATTQSVEGATSMLIEDLINGTDYSVQVRATNAAGNGAYSEETTAAPDEGADPLIVGVPAVDASDTSATVTWVVSKATSAVVKFGTLTASKPTQEYNKESRRTTHTVTLSDLLPCTLYSYKVISKDAIDNEVTSSEKTFTTTGCEGNAEVEVVQRNAVTVADGGVLDFTNTDVKTKLTVPANVKAGVDNLTLQAKKLERSSVQAATGVPEGKMWSEQHVYKFTAYQDESTKVSEFDAPISVTIDYTRDDIAGLNFDTLSIYHFADGGDTWEILSDCENTFDNVTGLGEITCKTNSFSIFGLFGESEPGATGGGGGGGFVSTPTIEIVDEETETETDISAEEESALDLITETEEEIMVEEDMGSESETDDIKADQAEEFSEENSSQPEGEYRFENDLWYGLTNAQVQMLQMFLNANGFTLTQEGPGSPGEETKYFGPLTQKAVIEFQNAYAEFILAPLGLTQGTGYVGPSTREYINENY